MTTVVVFGGTGFLGRRLVHRLAAERATVRVAVRYPEGPFPCHWRDNPGVMPCAISGSGQVFGRRPIQTPIGTGSSDFGLGRKLASP